MTGQIFTAPNNFKDILIELDKIFMKDGVIVPVSIKEIENIDYKTLRIYTHFRGIYCVVTKELACYISTLLDNKLTIEIGSGNGTLSLGLGIRGTDNKMQRWPEIQMMYFITGQPTIKYPDFIEEIDAIAAIKKYKPHTVVGSWMSSKFRNYDLDKEGNMYGPDEEEIITNCKRYILIGNHNIHKNNRLFNKKKYDCVLHRHEGLISRNPSRKDDFIAEFTKK
jgi:hypothetical protein